MVIRLTREQVKTLRRRALVIGAVGLVAAGQLEFIPWTLAGALEVLGGATAAAAFAKDIDKKLNGDAE